MQEVPAPAPTPTPAPTPAQPPPEVLMLMEYHLKIVRPALYPNIDVDGEQRNRITEANNNK